MATDRRRCTVFFCIVIFQLFSQITAKSSVIDLNEDNWYQMLEGEWMVEFFAPWCPACKALKPAWEDFASWSNDLEISVGQVDVTTSPGLSGRFMVTALPTIYHVKDGVFRQYRGSRDKDEFMNFVEERRWQEVEEVPVWKSPASFQMSVVSQFFKLSMVLRSVHSVLVEDYGLPTWGSYLVFALATILVGALLGLILVCIIDFVFPPKAPGPAPVITSAGLKADDDEEDLVEDSEVKYNVKKENLKCDVKEEVPKEETHEGEGERSDNEVDHKEEEEEKALSESEDKEKEDSQVEEDNDSQAEDDKECKNSPEVRRRRPRKD
ncbi:thioredoxin-related transmembrane protein 1-like isoform X2 [Homarus americanus]|uniref:thioredoxin-related transmembrane protein 1-like isoform X2 n=1 Tax=Homarus americanus TaxID=6706 RepID=UPI001C4674F5|nr:thioredoxin-related transmembrane protein 1-like isoform X2 [Homarus americanus]